MTSEVVRPARAYRRPSEAPIRRQSVYGMPRDAVKTKDEEVAAVGFFSMSREKKFTVITFCVANFCVGAFYSLLAPFFPQEALKKDCSSTMTGLIFGSYELVVVIMSPIYGNFLTTVGAKFMYVTGLFVCGVCSVLFGFLDWSPDGTIFIVMCFVVRCSEALGAAALSVASFSIMAYVFPDSVATMFGSLELFSGLGLMVGPPLGGALYQAGGFKLPFIVMGIIMVLLSFMSWALLPKPQDESQAYEGSILSLMKLPVISIMGLLLVLAAGSLGFVDVTLSLVLSDRFHLSPTLLGVAFLVGPGIYAIAAPFWGWLADRKPLWTQKVLVFGYVLSFVAFLLMGPAPFLGLPTNLLWLILVAQGLMGLGVGSAVTTFQVIIEAAKAEGYSDSLDTYGLVSGIFNFFFSFGAFIGPVAGGALNDALKFPWACVVIAGFLLLAAIILALYMIIYKGIMGRTDMYLEQQMQGERAPLLRNRSFDDSP